MLWSQRKDPLQLQTTLSGEKNEAQLSTCWSEIVALAGTDQVVALYSISTQFMVHPSAYCSVCESPAEGATEYWSIVSQSNSIFSKNAKIDKVQ